jgi:hypothetical protein
MKASVPTANVPSPRTYEELKSSAGTDDVDGVNGIWIFFI